MGPTTRMSAPLFSIVVPTFQRAKWLDECLASVAAQTFTDFECIVADDGSADETPAVVAAWSARDARFQHLPLTNGGSPGRTRNLGAARAAGRWLAFLDDDDLWVPHKLERQAEILARRPELALLFGRMDRFGDETGPWPDPPSRAAPDLLALLEGNVVPCSTAVVRADLFRATGGFDATLRFAEDYELWLRLCQRGPLHAMPDVLVRYRVHGTGLSRDERTQVECLARIAERAVTWGASRAAVAPLRRAVMRGRWRIASRERGFVAALPLWVASVCA